MFTSTPVQGAHNQRKIQQGDAPANPWRTSIASSA